MLPKKNKSYLYRKSLSFKKIILPLKQQLKLNIGVYEKRDREMRAGLTKGMRGMLAQLRVMSALFSVEVGPTQRG